MRSTRGRDGTSAGDVAFSPNLVSSRHPINMTNVQEALAEAIRRLPNAWAASTYFNVGEVANCYGLPAYCVLECIVAGVTGTSSPTATTEGETIVDGGVTWKVVNMQGSNLALPNHIVKGGKVASVSGLNMTHGAIESVIKRKLRQKSAGDVQTLPAKRLGLLTIDKDGNRGTVLAADPTTFIDDNTIGLWKPDGSSSCPNLAYGVSSLAVVNNLIKSGTINPVDGENGGNAAQADGTSGTYATENSINFPVGSATRMIRVEYTHFGAITANPALWWYGSTASGGAMNCQIAATNSLQISDNTTVTGSSGFSVEAGQKYLFDIGVENGVLLMYANGVPILKGAWVPATVAGALRLFSYNGSCFSGGVIHSIELRNKMRSPQEIAEQAAKMLYPVCWTDSTTSKRKNLTALLPNDGTISLGMFRTGASSLLSYNDTDWQWGRREGATGGNRKVTLEYKAFSSGGAPAWANPFGSRRLRLNLVIAQDTTGSNECDALPYHINGGTAYGVLAAFMSPRSRIIAQVSGGGVAYYNNAWVTSGYIGGYAEIMEPEEDVPDA